LEYEEQKLFSDKLSEDYSIENARELLTIYDPDKFENALYEMMRRHDATIGITWDTVDYYLDEYCLKDKKDEPNN